jgi:hypothetical protein
MSVTSFPAKPKVPNTVAPLDPDVVIEVLSRHGVNVSEAANELGVASADLRRLLWARPQLTDAAVEIEERRLDLAERNIYEALRSDDPRRRDAASMFTIRNSHRARKRGWITSSTSAAELSVSASVDQPRKISFSWRTSDNPPATDEFERDGRTFAVPRYGGDGDRKSNSESRSLKLEDFVEGELATPPVLIEPPASPEPPQVEPIPEPPRLPKWPGPGGPPPLVAHLYQPWSPPKQQRREPEDHPQPEPWRRMSRGGYR